MPSLEAVCGRLFGRPGWIPKALWGGLLSFVPILNVLALGYLLEFTLRLRRLGEWELPEWRDQNFPNLFAEGLRAFLILVAYVGIPLLAGWLLSEIVDFLTFDLLGIVSHFPLAIAGFIAPFLFLSAIHAYLSDGIFNDAWQIRSVLLQAKKFWPRLAIPVVAFWGIFLLAIPLYGLSFFLGTWVLLSYSTALQFSD